jgi:hypothetical protein
MGDSHGRVCSWTSAVVGGLMRRGESGDEIVRLVRDGFDGGGIPRSRRLRGHAAPRLQRVSATSTYLMRVTSSVNAMR